MIFDITGKLVIDHRARDWCNMLYPDHPWGCPNYNKKSDCPPTAPLVEDYFDLDKAHYFVVVQFDLGAHITWMKLNHPRMSDRQARNVLYWQGGVNRHLRVRSVFYTSQDPLLDYNTRPEAMGVNVIRTAKAVGLPIRPRPTDTVYKIAMLGQLKER